LVRLGTMADKISTGQTPSKVLHIRNLPYETTQDELEDLSRPFGKIVKTKLNVGTNRNQAFIEFPDTQSAVNMVHHFMSSAEPAKVCTLASATTIPLQSAAGLARLARIAACVPLDMYIGARATQLADSATAAGARPAPLRRNGVHATVHA
jgi:RNA recognition motif. (a.k.a. RRM, RBD, or RNP domain)